MSTLLLCIHTCRRCGALHGHGLPDGRRCAVPGAPLQCWPCMRAHPEDLADATATESVRAAADDQAEWSPLR